MSNPQRDARSAAMAAARQDQNRQRCRARTGVAAGLLIAIAFLVGMATHSSRTATPAAAAAVPLDRLPGLQTTNAPWAPEDSGLPVRLASLHLPPNGNESYHIHAHLAVYVDGKQVPVAANVSISQAAQLESPTHTHDTTGVIHIEAAAPSDAFTLGAFFDLWGVTFTTTRLGAYQAGFGKTVQVYVNGKRAASGPAAPLHAHDDIVVAYGSPGSSPTTDPHQWPQGE